MLKTKNKKWNRSSERIQGESLSYVLSKQLMEDALIRVARLSLSLLDAENFKDKHEAKKIQNEISVTNELVYLYKEILKEPD